MSDKDVKTIAIRMGSGLTDKIDAIIERSCMVYNKQEFTLFAIRRMYMHTIFEFDVSPEKENFDSESASDVITLLLACKREYEIYKEDLQQFIIRIPSNFYERLTHMCDIMDLSVQDFIKGSIIFEMRTINLFNENYDNWKSFVDSMDRNELREMLINTDSMIEKYRT